MTNDGRRRDGPDFAVVFDLERGSELNADDDLPPGVDWLRYTVEHHSQRLNGLCRHCQNPFGGFTTGRDLLDLLSWWFDYCSNRCRRAAGEPERFNLQEFERRLQGMSS